MVYAEYLNDLVNMGCPMNDPAANGECVEPPSSFTPKDIRN